MLEYGGKWEERTEAHLTNFLYLPTNVLESLLDALPTADINKAQKGGVQPERPLFPHHEEKKKNRT